MLFIFALISLFTGVLTAMKADGNFALKVSGFGALVSNHQEIPSHIAFHVHDPRPEYNIDVDCIFVTNETRPTLFIGGWWPCNPDFDVAFWFERDSLKLRRPWLLEQGDPESRAIGLTNRQSTMWSNGTFGSCANVTNTIAGTFYSRTTDWEFPVVTLLS